MLCTWNLDGPHIITKCNDDLFFNDVCPADTQVEEQGQLGGGLTGVGGALRSAQDMLCVRWWDGVREEELERSDEGHLKLQSLAPLILQRHENKGAAERTVHREWSTEHPELPPATAHSSQTGDKKNTYCWENQSSGEMSEETWGCLTPWKPRKCVSRRRLVTVVQSDVNQGD